MFLPLKSVLSQNRQGFTGSVLGFLVTVAIFSLYAGSHAPDVNESHYLTKAKHFWDPSYGQGDLFLDSKDAHWFFFATFGSLTYWLSLPAAAWVGRLIGWMIVAAGWCTLAYRAWPRNYAGALTAPLWLAAMHWGHLSGEWVVGGCEAKVIAYGLSFFGLSEILRQRWSRGWWYFGAASAFHVLTGGWITLASLLTYLTLYFRSRRKAVTPTTAGLEPFTAQLTGLVGGGLIALLGLVPAILLNRGLDAATADQGAVIYVYQRLSHHLSPLHFAVERWYWFLGLVAVTLLVWKVTAVFNAQPSDRSQSAIAPNQSDRVLPTFGWLVGFVSLFAIVGILIDASLSSWATNWSANLLRYYWFRWNDVIWPILLVLFVIRLVAPKPSLESQDLLTLSGGGQSSYQSLIRWLGLAVLCIPGVVLIGQRWLHHNRSKLSPADRASLVLRHESPSAQQATLNDWLDVCYWIRTNTPEGTLFLTPRFQQTFKWNAQRAELASWKDAPQDPVSLIEWESRMLEIYPRDQAGYGTAMSMGHLRAMYQKYRMNYVVLDRRFQKSPPPLPLLHSNETYAVFEFPDSNASSP
jgi:hypothetical protein